MGGEGLGINKSAETADALLAQPVERRTVLKLGAAFALLLNEACKGKPVKPKQEQNPSQEFDISPEAIESADKVIQAYESGYIGFIRSNKEKIDRIKSPYFRKLILETADLVQKNSKNPDKNFSRFLQKHPQLNTDNRYLNKDISQFFYYAESGEFVSVPQAVRANAAFSPPVRVMKIRNKFDRNNLLHQVSYMHELIHVLQDDEFRRNSDTKDEYYDKVLRYNSERIKLMEAYTKVAEIELLNVFSDGMLEKLPHPRQIDLDNFDFTKLLRILNLSNTDIPRLQNVILFASPYFFEGGAKGNKLPDLFVKFHSEVTTY